MENDDEAARRADDARRASAIGSSRRWRRCRRTSSTIWSDREPLGARAAPRARTRCGARPPAATTRWARPDRRRARPSRRSSASGCRRARRTRSPTTSCSRFNARAGAVKFEPYAQRSSRRYSRVRCSQRKSASMPSTCAISAGDTSRVADALARRARLLEEGDARGLVDVHRARAPGARRGRAHELILLRAADLLEARLGPRRGDAQALLHRAAAARRWRGSASSMQPTTKASFRSV